MTENYLEIFGWWISVIEIPVLSALFWMVWSVKREQEKEDYKIRDDLNHHKVEVAKSYAQTSDLRLLENRLTSHLLRIEAKLEITAMKTEKISTLKNP